MDNNKYSVLISNVYAGQLTNSNDKAIRTILFSIDKNNLANDLLYDSPRYPILGISSENNNDLIIKRYTSLKYYLEYFEYDCFLDIIDIIKIKNFIFYSDFVEEHDYLFNENQDKTLFKELATRTLKEAIKEKKPMNAFRPKKVEGKIKRLSVFKTY